MDEVRRGFRSLLVFRGRDAPAQFWPYAGVIIGSAIVGGNLLFIAAVSVSTAMAEPHEFEAVEDSAAPPMTPFLVWVALVGLITVLLLAAAVTRRLHDRDHRGSWALIPVALLGAGLYMFGRLEQNFEGTPDPNSTLLNVILAIDLAYFAALAILVWQLIKRGTDTANRFGAPP